MLYLQHKIIWRNRYSRGSSFAATPGYQLSSAFGTKSSRKRVPRVGQPSWLSLGFGPFPVKLERKIRLLEERGEVFPTSCRLRGEGRSGRNVASGSSQARGPVGAGR